MIIWVAGYPRSGATWVQLALASYIRDTPIPLHSLYKECSFMHHDAHPPLYIECKGLTIPQMSHRIINDARPLIAVRLHNLGTPQVVRTRNASLLIGSGTGARRTITKTAKCKSILVVRHPCDTVVSLKHFYNWSFHKALTFITNPEARLERDEVAVPSHPSDWATFHRTWLNDMSPLVLRYEDIMRDAKAAFTKVLHHLDLPLDHSRAIRNLSYASFRAQREYEMKYNAAHPSRKDAPLMYAHGKPHAYMEVIPPKHRKEVEYAMRQLRERFSSTLKRFSYI